MRGRITSFFDGRWVIRPDGGSVCCDVFADESDLSADCKDLFVTFEVVPSTHGFRAVNIRADEGE
jgi:hypothetical protein